MFGILLSSKTQKNCTQKSHRYSTSAAQIVYKPSRHKGTAQKEYLHAEWCAPNPDGQGMDLHPRLDEV